MLDKEKERPGQGAPSNSLISILMANGRVVTRENARGVMENSLLDVAESRAARTEEHKKANTAQLKQYIIDNELKRWQPEEGATLDHASMTEAEKEIHANASKLGAANRADEIVLAHRAKAAGRQRPDQFSIPGGGIAGALQARSEAESAIQSRLMKLEDLENMPAAKPLIKGVLDLDSESWLIGQSGGFKSFVAVDWACHVAAGVPEWRGNKVAAGDVLYVVAEGVKGFAKRVKAWKKAHGKSPDRLQILAMPVQARGDAPDQVSQEWRVLTDLVASLKPALIVLDTQARMTLGIEENSSKEMGLWIRAVAMLREASGGCVLVVHHTGRNGGDARGSSAIDGAQDMEWKVERDARKLKATLRCDKSKDGDDRGRFSFAMDVVVIGVDEDGQDITSLVPGDLVIPEDSREQGIAIIDRIQEDGASLTFKEWILRTLAASEPKNKGITQTELRRLVDSARKQSRPVPLDPINHNTFKNAIKRMLDGGELFWRGQRVSLTDPAKDGAILAAISQEKTGCIDGCMDDWCTHECTQGE